MTDRIPVSKEHSPNVRGGSFVIQPGTLIMIPIEAIGRDPKSFGEDADSFRPERWGEETAGTQRFKVAGGPAFLFGPRGCIGEHSTDTLPLPPC
jgi:cytochrome P450